MADNDDPIAESEIKGATASDTEASRKKHLQAMQRFDSVSVPQQEMRAQSLEARRFVTIPGAMWEGSWGEQFENSPRPEVDKITKGLEKIETDYRENRLTVDFVPGNGGDSETADTLDGMHRADSEYFKAQQGRDNAFQEGIRGGFGAWRLTTDYADPYDPEDDSQRVNPAVPIVDADQSVYFGPSTRYDKSDAPWAFVVTAEARAEAEDKWGQGIAPWPLNEWKFAWDWYTPDVVRIAEYYEVETPADKLLIFTQKESGEEQRYFATEIDDDEIANLTDTGWVMTERPIKRRRIRKYIMSGSAILKDCGYIAGPHIPIVPFYFRRDYVDNMERWRGYVGKKMDSQRIYNTRVGKLVEVDSMSPMEKPVFDPTQIDAIQAEQWSRSNIDRLPYLTAHALRNPDGSVAQTGPSFTIKPHDPPPVTVGLLQIASGDLTDDDQNVEEVKANTSEEAMELAAARVDAKSGIPLDNMRQSVAREGEIYLGMGREVYYEPGREVETLSMDGQDGKATLVQMYLDNNQIYRIRNDLTQGKFKVVASVQEATATAQGKTVRKSLDAAEVAVQAQDMELAQAYILTAAMNMNGEGMQDMQRFARNKAIKIGLVEPNKEEQAQIAQMQEAAAQQPPDAATQALTAQAGKDASTAKLNEAKAVQTLADAGLKQAQAQAVGGPESAPEVPTGLQAANDIADIRNKFAGADLKQAQAAHLQRKNQSMSLTDMLAVHGATLNHRKQEHAEKVKGA